MYAVGAAASRKKNHNQLSPVNFEYNMKCRTLCLSLAPPLQTGESREFGLVLKGAESLLDYGNYVLAFAFFKKKIKRCYKFTC